MRFHGKRGKRTSFTRRSARVGGPNSTTAKKMAELPKGTTVNFIESFKAVVMEQTLRHRGTDANLTEQFITAIELERGRYADKALDPATMDEVTNIAARAIARVRKLGVLAFEPGAE
jgi:hypothetical protein